MEIQEYIKEKKNLYEYISEYIQKDQVNDLDNYESSENHFNFKVFIENCENLSYVFKLIAQISNHHHRSPRFIDRIKQILFYIKHKIKQTYSNLELFQIFEDNKFLLLFLFENEFIESEEKIYNYILKSKSFKINKYLEFFYKEIKKFFNSEIKENIESEFSNIFQGDMDLYENYRHIGENESYICRLIRNDSIEEFISYVNRINLSISNTVIKQSIFETNSFLLNKKPTLIEYASFFGSIQIFQYLRLNQVELTSSLWLYAIHSNNPELIHLLEENNVQPPNDNYDKCIKESIKCHHNDISNYFFNNCINIGSEESISDSTYLKNSISYGFQYHNYEYIKPELKPKDLLFYSAKYNYFQMLKILSKNKIFKELDGILLLFFYNIQYFNFNDIYIV